MTGIVERLRAATMDKDNFPRMDSERQVPVGLAKEAADQIERLTRRVTQLGVLVETLADELEAELNGHYPPEVRAYPSEQRRYERDMANVYEARRALEHKP